MQGSFHLGDWLVHPTTGRITRNGQTIHVRAKVMDLLVFLAERQGEVVSKDKLLEGVWGTDALSESALTRSMTELRQALKDDAEKPSLIETIPKRGYRVIVPVQPVSSKVPSSPRDPLLSTEGSAPRSEGPRAQNCAPDRTPLRPVQGSGLSIHTHLVWALAGLILGVLAAVLAMVVLPTRTPAPARRTVFLLSPPESTTFGAFPTEPQPAVSPDGRQIATVAMAKDATRRIWVHTLDSLAAQPLPGTEGAGFPFWSPDGRWIGFFAEGKLKKIRPWGGPPEIICAAADGFGATWGSRGLVLFAPQRESGLYSVSASGGDPVPLTTLDRSREETSHRFPYFLPDGTRYVYLVRSNRSENRGLFLGSLDSTGRKRLTTADSNGVFVEPGYVLYVRDATLMAQAVDMEHVEPAGEALPIAEGVLPGPTVRLAPFSAAGTLFAYRPGGMLKTRLVWADRKGKVLGTVGSPARYLTPALSPDGRRLAVDVLDFPAGGIDTWVFDLERDVSSRFTFGPSLNGYPAWGPDGARIAFASNRGGTWSLYERGFHDQTRESAQGDHPLLGTGSDNYPQGWSSDGRWFIYVDRREATGNDLWVLPVEGDGEPVPLLQTPFNESQGQLSPDGRWLAYSSDETGRREVYVRSFPSLEGKVLVSTNGGCQPRWRADGKELFYVYGRSLMAVSIGGDASLKPGLPTELFKTYTGRTNDITWEYVAAPDGQRFLYKELVFEDGGSPLVVVLNWQDLMRR